MGTPVPSIVDNNCLYILLEGVVMGLIITDREPSITKDELWEASPCGWCLLREICYIHCDAKNDWLRIFHGFDTFQELREFFRIFPTGTTATTSVSYACASSTEIERNTDNDSCSRSEQMQGMSRKAKLFRSLRRRISKRIKRIL